MSGGDSDEKTPEAEEPLRNRRCSGGGGFFRRADVHFVLLTEGTAFRRRDTAYHNRDFPAKGMIHERSVHMKIVVLKSPKLFAGLLRVMFGIRKQSVE